MPVRRIVINTRVAYRGDITMVGKHLSIEDETNIQQHQWQSIRQRSKQPWRQSIRKWRGQHTLGNKASAREKAKATSTGNHPLENPMEVKHSPRKER
jgi:hypothetical protein